MSKPPISSTTLLLAWIALVSLTIATYLTWKGSFGVAGEAVNFVIAIAKATLVTVVYMEIRKSHYRARFAALAGLVWMAILIGLVASDYSTRDWNPAPVFWNRSINRH
ncbi:MAG: hypothetical protein R2748_05975 [Bryobacterales bacterium]